MTVRRDEEVILITDHTNFGRGNGMIVAPMTAFHRVITDVATPGPDVVALRGRGIDILVVEPTAQVPALRSVPGMPVAASPRLAEGPEAAGS